MQNLTNEQREVVAALDQRERLKVYALAGTGKTTCLLNAFLSGGRLLPGQARKAKTLGVVKGFPDVFLPVKRSGYGGLFIELKRPQGGKLSPEQRAWLEELGGQGYLAVCCKGVEEARRVIERYLRGVEPC